jgi:ParB/RepB/Spo0J family partition protein
MKDIKKKIDDEFLARDKKKSKKDIVVEQFVLHGNKRVIDVPLECIRVEDQIRKDFGDIEDLSRKIENLGQGNPVRLMELRDTEGEYLLIGGERRFRAVKHSGKDSINATIVPYIEDPLERKKLAFSDNHDRKQLNIIEMADAVREFSELGMKQSELAELFNKSVETIKLYSRIGKLTKKEKNEYLKRGFGIKEIKKDLSNKKSGTVPLLASKKDIKSNQLSLFQIKDERIKLSSTTFDFKKESRGDLEKKVTQLKEALKKMEELLKGKE